MKKNLLTVMALIMLLPVCHKLWAANVADSLYAEKYRPQYHFSPRSGWVGDPCGFMYHKGRYRLYWWGNAESDDLVHYTETTPFAMKGAPENISYFTGSAVVDKDNTAGFGKDAYIAAYTSFEKDTKKQSQSISFSHDGKTFSYYGGNPVVDIWSTEFRDPTVIWHEESRRWVMAVAKVLERKVAFYTSADLKSWTWESDFGPAGDSEKSWECPDLFQLSIDGDEGKKSWVLVVSVNWARVQYFVGDFDGHRFTVRQGQPAEPQYVDSGLDFYAPRTFQDFDGTLADKIMMGWVNTWDYANEAPSSYGKGFWSLPRRLGLVTTSSGLVLTQQPIEALKKLRCRKTGISRRLAKGVARLAGFSPSANRYELDVTFVPSDNDVCGLNLCVGSGRKVVLTYDSSSHTFVIDRTNATDAVIPKFSRLSYGVLHPSSDGGVRLHIFVDSSSIEVFSDDGLGVFTLLTYPAPGQTGIEVFSMRGKTNMEMNAWHLKSIWTRK